MIKKGLFDSSKSIAKTCDTLIVFLSAGRDSAVMLNILTRFIPPERLKIYHLYFFYPLLSFQKRYFDTLERKYKIKINYLAHYDLQNIHKSESRKKITQTDVENLLREQHDTRWVAWGYRKDESLQRRGMMAHLPNGIDFKYGKVYPLIDWSSKDIKKFVDSQNIPLTVEYSYGLRDMTVIKYNQVLWLKNNFPEDFERLSKTYPHLKADLIRLEEEIF